MHAHLHVRRFSTVHLRSNYMEFAILSTSVYIAWCLTLLIEHIYITFIVYTSSIQFCLFLPRIATLLKTWTRTQHKQLPRIALKASELLKKTPFEKIVCNPPPPPAA